MRITGKDFVVPAGARWVCLTDELLASGVDEWIELADRFEPEPHGEGEQMAEWLREGIRKQRMPEATYLLHTREGLLGFFAVSEVQVKISRSARPIFELHKHKLDGELQAGLMLSRIARARSTEPGFGHVLFDGAVGVATEWTSKIVAVFVLPDSPGVSKMWQQDYYLREMDNPEIPGLLYFPTGPAPEPRWPS
jgi:hypothetical protein